MCTLWKVPDSYARDQNTIKTPWRELVDARVLQGVARNYTWYTAGKFFSFCTLIIGQDFNRQNTIVVTKFCPVLINDNHMVIILWGIGFAYGILRFNVSLCATCTFSTVPHPYFSDASRISNQNVFNKQHVERSFIFGYISYLGDGLSLRYI